MPKTIDRGTSDPVLNLRERARRQADQVHAMLVHDIDQGRVLPGERIPTERRLAERFGASRSVIRTALAELDRAGKIVRRVGHGTVVRVPPGTGSGPTGFTLLDTSPAELLEFRLALEPGLAEAITLNASEGDIRAVLERVAEGDAAMGLEQWERSDRAFHRQLVAASHNRLSIGVYDAVIGIRRQRPWLETKEGHTDPRNWGTYQAQHREIATALAERDAPRAAAALRGHLLHVRVSMLGLRPA